MPTEPTYTDLAVSIGELKRDVANVLSGVNEIKSTLHDTVDRVGKVETKQALAEQRLDAMDAKTARKPPWTAIAALVVALGGEIVRVFFRF